MCQGTGQLTLLLCASVKDVDKDLSEEFHGRMLVSIDDVNSKD